jgi:DNA-nicking Smr family endonuclease
VRAPRARPAAGLEQLGAVRDELRRCREKDARRLRAESERQARAAEQQQVFARAVGPITPLPAHGRALPVVRATPPVARQRERDEREALQSSLSDGLDGDALLESDDSLSFRRAHIGADVVRKLRRGEWAIQAQVDLHGLTRDAARERVGTFLREAQRRGLRCVRVVHGKGHGSPGKTPVLKGRVQRWLAQCETVDAFAQARAADGGAGALVVLLSGAPAKSG